MQVGRIPAASAGYGRADEPAVDDGRDPYRLELREERLHIEATLRKEQPVIDDPGGFVAKGGDTAVAEDAATQRLPRGAGAGRP